MASSFARTIPVPANTFTSSGLVPGATDHVSVTAAGIWDYCAGSCPVGPNGTSGFHLPSASLPGANISALIGSVDNQVTWKLIGAGPATVGPATPGTLQFTINDIGAGSFSGQMTVTISGGSPVELANVADTQALHFLVRLIGPFSTSKIVISNEVSSAIGAYQGLNMGAACTDLGDVVKQPN